MSGLEDQAILETYFTSLCQFGYDKAREIIEKERDFNKTPSLMWTNLLNVLVQLTSLEKSYMQLLFLLPKGFFRKDTSLKGAYQSLRGDLLRTEESASTASLDPSEQLLSHFALQLGHFVTARLDMIDFYEKLYNVSNSKTANYEELIQVISDICKANSKNFHHPVLSSLKTCFSYECETLEQLLCAQQELQVWNFMAALIHLNGAHSKLSAWGASVLPKENRRLSFRASFLKPSQIPALYQWLTKLKNFLISKFSLYFHDLLSRQTTPQMMNNFLSKTSNDHYHRLATFQKKLDAVSILLIFDTNDMPGFKGPGYHHPARKFDTPLGLDTYPIVVSYPPDKPQTHVPNIVMIMEKRAAELNSYDRCTFMFDKIVDVTYFLARAEPRMTMVVICNGKKVEKDSHITSFLSDFTTQLRCHRQFASLKPGTKS